MGKVLKLIGNGPAGSYSRENDAVIVSFPYIGSTPIDFGTPLFLDPTALQFNAVRPFTDASADTAETFVGFAVRDGAKTPNAYGDDVAKYNQYDQVDVLTRGEIVLKATGQVRPHSQVYLRKSDGAILGVAPQDLTTVIALPNVVTRTWRDSNACFEATVSKRNIY